MSKRFEVEIKAKDEVQYGGAVMMFFKYESALKFVKGIKDDVVLVSFKEV